MRRLASAVLIVAHLSIAGTAAGSAAVETGDLEKLRAEALDLVNRARSEHDLGPLRQTDALNEAAQAHAAEMARRNYYGHVSPEGVTPRDRFLDRGGSPSKQVAENIARCSGCPVPPTVARIRSFQQGWMNSPPHRENILTDGLDGFGFGIAAREGRVYAVQTFAGAGMPRGLEAGEEPVALAPDALGDRAAEAINRARRRQGLAPVGTSPVLDRVAQRLLPEDASGGPMMARHGKLADLLHEEGQGDRWTGLQVVVAGCTGCGTRTTAQDVRSFVGQWLDNPQYRPTLLGRGIDSIGFAMRADGSGRKTAIAVAGRRR